jgi:hypothetical protein
VSGTPAQDRARCANIAQGRKARGKKACAEMLQAIGHDGGLWSWASSPHVPWLATVIA